MNERTMSELASAILGDIAYSTDTPMEEIISDFARFNAAIDRLMEIGFTDDVATELVAKLWEPPFAK